MADTEKTKSLEASSRVHADTLEIVAVASQAQAAKVRVIIERIDTITQLDPSKVKNIADLLHASKADGGCGIGCW